MTPQEQDLLKGLTDRINQTNLTDKDPEAEQYIDQSLAKNPDALYILAQTVLVQQYALDNAKKQLDQAKQDLDATNQTLTETRQQLQQAQQQPVKHTSFLGSLLGTDDRPAPPPPPAYQTVQTYSQPVAYAQPVSYGSPYGAPMGGGGSFLRSAMTTAAGVAAGAIAFEGIEDLMHGFGQHAGYGYDNFGGGGFGGGQPREEIINNNYYGDATPEHHGGDLTDRFAAAGDQPSPDIEDRRDDSSQAFADTDNTTDDTTDDSSNFDDSTSDDSSSFDDSSSSSDDSGF